MQHNNNSNSFGDLGIAPKLLEVLAKNKFISPTPIQSQSIPHAITGKDLMGIAQTGTGKTLAFGIPMIQRLAQSGNRMRGLIVVPTRELALQVNESLRKVGGSIGLRTAILIGGESVGRQIKTLKAKPHIIIGTPGRLIDLLEGGNLTLSDIGILVLDEADRMLDMGFQPQIKKILERIPSERQTLLFSATMPAEIVAIANSYMKSPLRIEVVPAGTTVKSVSQEIFFLERSEKPAMLKKILEQYRGSILVFTRTKYGAKNLAVQIRKFGETATEIHSNRSLNQRLEALNGFKIGKYRVMVATDIAARGIDVTGIQLVVNYDLPENAEDYVHRIGRTGRAAMTGHAISFATHEQRRDIKIIERLIRKALPISQTPKLEKIAPTHQPPQRERMERPNDRGGRTQHDRFKSGYKSGSKTGSRNQRNDQPGQRKRKPLRAPFQKNLSDFKWGSFNK